LAQYVAAQQSVSADGARAPPLNRTVREKTPVLEGEYLMKRHPFLSVILVISLLPISAFAGEAANELGVCLADSLTGKERKALARWIFFGMAAHPEIRPYTEVSDQAIDDLDKLVGELVTRLMTSDCPQQARAAVKDEGSAAIEYAFGLVGQVAMQELMMNQEVSQTLGGFEKYVDQEAIQSLYE
jgi:hypothetical protein